MSIRFVDSHAHLDGPEFEKDLDAVRERAAAVGITDFICVGASEGLKSNPRTLALVSDKPGFFASVGLHPHDAHLVTDETLTQIRTWALHPKVVAIGETGLDYHYDRSLREVQRAAFRAFLGMAKDLKLPCIVHTREAEEDTIQILRDEGAQEIGGVIHCFTGTSTLAQAALELGFYISFSGVLTFRNAAPLRAIAKELPKDRVLVETDCPYLAPVPMRGQRNEPSFVEHTVATLAELWSMSVDEVKATTGENARRFFSLP